MPDEPQIPANDRFKAEMPQIPGVGGAVRKAGSPQRGTLLIAGGLAVVLLATFVGGRMLWKTKKRADLTPAPVAQIDVPADTPAAVPDLAVPVATEMSPAVAVVGDLAKPWDSRQFSFRNGTTGETVPALLIRLPGGSAAQAAGYWAFGLKEAYGRCQLEYVADLTKLKTDYGFGGASHPMVGNPCSRTVYDPLKYGAIGGNVLARGAIVQGTDLRPPLGIEVKIKGKDILAVRME
jgi:hypothetical protein